MKNGKARIKTIAAAAVLLILLSVFLVWLIPELHERACRKRIYEDLDERLLLVSSSGIRIIQSVKEDGGTSYSMGASGVVIARDGTRYYALTANHVVSNPDLKLFVMTLETPSWAEYKEKGKGSVDAYFGEMPEAEVVYRDDQYDLAVISFKPKEYLEVAQVAEENPAKGDRVALITSRYDNGRRYFAKDFGKVTSSKPELFEPGGGEKPSPVLKTNAYITTGSSGGAVFNEKMKLAGMVIGADIDFLGRFRYAIFMPAEEISACIRRWQQAS